jgi:hypothetical protein
MPLGDKALLPLTSGRIWARPKSIPISLTVGERRRERERRKEDQGRGRDKEGVKREREIPSDCGNRTKGKIFSEKKKSPICILTHISSPLFQEQGQREVASTYSVYNTTSTNSVP